MYENYLKCVNDKEPPPSQQIATIESWLIFGLSSGSIEPRYRDRDETLFVSPASPTCKGLREQDLNVDLAFKGNNT